MWHLSAWRIFLDQMACTWTVCLCMFHRYLQLQKKSEKSLYSKTFPFWLGGVKLHTSPGCIHFWNQYLDYNYFFTSSKHLSKATNTGPSLSPLALWARPSQKDQSWSTEDPRVYGIFLYMISSNQTRVMMNHLGKHDHVAKQDAKPAKQ